MKATKSEELRCHWSEPILARRHAIGTGESDSASSCSSQESGMCLSHPTNDLVPSQAATASACSCHQHCQEKLKQLFRPHSLLEGDSKGLHSSKKSHRENSSKVRHQLQLHLSTSQVEEAMAQEHHDNLNQTLQKAGELLLTVMNYVQSLEVGHRAAFRMHRLAANLIQNHCVPKEQPCNIQSYEPKDICIQLVEFCSNITSSLELSSQLSKLQMEHEAKRNDFLTASKNFWHHLESSKLSASQLRRLESQFNAIHVGYQHTRNLLDQELPKVIDKRLKMLSKSFSNLNMWLKHVADNCNDLAKLSQDLSEILEVNAFKVTGNCPSSPCPADMPSKTYNCPMPTGNRSGQLHNVLYA